MKEDSGQAKTSGLARQSIPESLERQRRQMRLVHVRIKSSQGLGLICGDGHDSFRFTRRSRFIAFMKIVDSNFLKINKLKTG